MFSWFFSLKDRHDFTRCHDYAVHYHHVCSDRALFRAGTFIPIQPRGTRIEGSTCEGYGDVDLEFMNPTNDKTSTILRLKKVAYIPGFQDRFGMAHRMYIRVEELEVKDPAKSTERHLRCLDNKDRGRPVQMQAMEVDVGGFGGFSGYAVITLQHIKWDISRRNKCIHKE